MSRRNVASGGRRIGLACLLGRHHYGEDHGIGAGIQRRACSLCGAVTIDLTKADESSEPSVQGWLSATFPGSDH